MNAPTAKSVTVTPATVQVITTTAATIDGVSLALISTAATANATATQSLVATDLTAAKAILAADTASLNTIQALVSTALATANAAAPHSDTCTALQSAYLLWGSPFTLASWLCSDPCIGVDGVTCSSNGLVTSISASAILWTSGTRAIPPSFTLYSALQTLTMNSAQLTGTFPIIYSQLVSLTLLDLGTNNLNGSLPSQLSTLTAMNHMYLNDNAFVGAIPQTWSTLVSLTNSGGPGLNLIGNAGLCGSLPTLTSVSYSSTGASMPCSSPPDPSPPISSPSPPSPPASPPLPPSTVATLAITLTVDAAAVSTPAGLKTLSQGIAQQYATIQDIALSRVVVSDLQIVTLGPGRRQLKATVAVSATVSLFFDPSVTNVASRMASLHANPIAGFGADFLTSFGVTGATVALLPSAPSPPPFPGPPLSPPGQLKLACACM